ncbi:MAG: thymidylate kinase, partial [Lachnospiraceae bacterium]|nr:thymidylate kinase [Lachnospiraceae bacterium]
MAKGKLIVIEGLDGSGKATQCGLLCNILLKNGCDLRKLSFPNYESPSSALVKMYLSGELSKTPSGVNAYAASSFYAVDRYADYLKNWKEDYENGKFFIADRYSTSNAIYQMSKLSENEWSSFLDWIEDYEYNKLGIPMPDKVIYLDMSVKVSQKLLSVRYNGDESKKDIHESNVRFLSECRVSALYAAEHCGWNVIRCDDGENPRSAD